MLLNVPYLEEIAEDQKRLRREFDDKNIYFGRNVRNHIFEAWYKPSSSRPYKICSGVNVFHCLRTMKKRMINDRKKAKDILREIDEHNDKIVKDKQDDALNELQIEMRKIASGKQYFTPVLQGVK